MKRLHRHILHKFRQSPLSGRSIAALLLILLGIKQRVVHYAYGSQITADNINSIFVYLGFLGNDLIILGIVLLLVLINLNTSKRIIHIITNSISGILVIAFFIDIITIYAFQTRLSFFDMFAFFSASNARMFFGSVMFILSVFIALCIGTFFFTQKYLHHLKKTQIQYMVALRFFIVSIGIGVTMLFTKNNKELTQNILSLNIHQSNEDRGKSYMKYQDYFVYKQGNNKHPNIILLFAESFSAIDSQRVGGEEDNFPLTDKIQSEGTTFTNFFANGCVSESAHIATLQGVEPRENPLKKTDINYASYTGATEPLPQFFNQQGYQTIFVSSVPLTFLDQRQFVENMKFQRIIGEEAFSGEKKYVFNAAPDQSLYNKTLNVIQEYQTGNKPFFLTLQSISSHKPYDTPYGESTENMMTYVDRSLYAFYIKLKKSGFFTNGILIIVGDHRKMEPIGDNEFKKYGKTSNSRVVATMIGKNIDQNSFITTPIQHTDIFYSLKELVGSGKVEISKLANNIFSNREQRRNRGVRYCRGLGEKDYYLLKANDSGHKITEVSDPGVMNYIKAFKSFQAEKILNIQNLSGYHIPTVETGTSEGFIYAHGGGPHDGRIPNAQKTFDRAKQEGADGVEIDVSYTKDHDNIVMHGPTLQSTTCGPNKYITGYTVEELKLRCKLRNGEKIQTLKEFLQRNRTNFKKIIIEIKVFDPTFAEEQTLKAINDVLEAKMEDQVIFISYDRIANYIIGSHKKITGGRDSYSGNEGTLIAQFPHKYFLMNKDTLELTNVQQAEAMNKELIVYTINTVKDLKYARDLGVRSVLTDNVALMKRLTKKIK